jgi:hypothetical protein
MSMGVEEPSLLVGGKHALVGAFRSRSSLETIAQLSPKYQQFPISTPSSVNLQDSASISKIDATHRSGFLQLRRDLQL